ncbi:MAG: thermonuclease family protein [Planctomycetes bacterium]|nr:thermonuclease family protein [Planctomycetota bacterium]MCB9905969.1 thermonuclease family protein [Planctomycetota bacterium]
MLTSLRAALSGLPALALLFSLAAASVQNPAPPAAGGSESPAVTASPTPARPEFTTELYEVVKVVDGDTIHILRGDTVEKLRLLNVDTEERIRAGQKQDPAKPMTAFGEECALWAQDFFAALAGEDGKTRVRLLFPEGKESRGTFGRLLCHVILEDGRDFNLMLVQLGKSPYYNKYGNSRIKHGEFVAAQMHAREKQLGIWNPKVNEPETPGAPVYKRNYDELMIWWQARADAIDAYYVKCAEEPFSIFSSEDDELLDLAQLMGDEVQVFGAIDRIFEEQDGSRTLLLRASNKDKALRVRIPADAVEALKPAEIDALTQYGRQNYAYFSGKITTGERGFEMILSDPANVVRGGPEPAMPAGN